ncbi:hypothetical protein ACW5WQ_20910 [Aeromonas rivuli]|uniref:hypothetical protein n=1 Tax=Aeromonas rivuli TaxID=648794 RepID=UPI0006949B99|nr:hypothetical protein [Aeromonas rivuli]
MTPGHIHQPLATPWGLRVLSFAVRLALAAPKWAAGFCSLNDKADSRTYSDMRSFCVRKKPSYAQIMVRRGREALAPAGFFVASLQTLLRLTTPFCSGLVRFNEPDKEAAAMVATPTPVVPKFFTFLIALRPCRLAALRRVRTVSTVAHTEAEARSLLGGLPLVFISRCPAAKVAA